MPLRPIVPTCKHLSAFEGLWKSQLQRLLMNWLSLHIAGCPKLLAAETNEIGLPQNQLPSVTCRVYQNKNVSEEFRIYYFICPNESNPIRSQNA